jgi:hypothetical protein
MIAYINDTYADTLIDKISNDLKAESIEFDDEFFTCHVNFDTHVLTIRFNEPVDLSYCSHRSEFYLDNKFLTKGIQNPSDLFDAMNDAYEALKEVRFNL